HILLLLQTGGRDVKLVLFSHGHRSFINPLPEVKEVTETPAAESNPDITQASETEAPVSISWHRRQELLALLQKCIGALAIHIYYANNVSDFIKPIIPLLKPYIAPEPPTADPSPESQIAPAASDSSPVQDSFTADAFFSFPPARIIALKAIKDILVV